jgi:hypothetical protein
MLRRLIDRFRRRPDTPAAAPTPLDHAQERENRRQGGMSDEDRAWEAASQDRDRQRREQTQAPTEEP